MTSKNIPFDFVLDHLISPKVTVRQMFGMFAIYVDENLKLLLRQRDDHRDENGIWVATSREHHKSLKGEIPSLRSISFYSDGLKETSWQVIPADADAFEVHAIKACELINKKDIRIGKQANSLKKVKTRRKEGR